ncbi:MAG: hypothetical protein JWN61_154 [Pseudonocardiales bacterium]|nr:hypothetical protein [Pseudonocardiales bacterium]
MPSHEHISQTLSAETVVAAPEPAGFLAQRMPPVAGLVFGDRPAPAMAMGPQGLVVGRADDPAEAEAEAAGAHVLSVLRRRALRSSLSSTSGEGTTRRISRAGASGGLEGGPVTFDTERLIADEAGQGGRPLHYSLRSSMEGAMGADFGDVRVHSGPKAEALSAEVGARAFTTGNDIFLGAGAPELESDAGIELLGHELTHTIQQRGGSPAPVRRKIDVKAVADVALELGITKTVSVVEVPKALTFKTTTPFKDYPAESLLNLPGAMNDKSIIVLDFPDYYTNPAYDDEFKGAYGAMPASSVTDGLGGGAYNHTLDLVVLEEGYTAPALLHELGHKAQNDVGINADTASVLFLEYQNVMLHQNNPWVRGLPDAPAPRLQYTTGMVSTAVIKRQFKISKATEMTEVIWEEFKRIAVAALHHDRPEAEGVLTALEFTLGGKYATESNDKGTFAQQVKFNLIAEYLSQR